MKQRNRKIWAFLGALWLVLACVAGCRIPNTGGTGTGQEITAAAATGALESVSAEESSDTNLETGTPLGLEETGDFASSAQEASRSEEDKGSQQPSEDSQDTRITEAALAGRAETDFGGQADVLTVEESGSYTSKEEVALYIHLFGHLPDNYITKREAEALGWDSGAGNLWEVAPGMSIGGSRFGNYEGALPDKEGRRYYECDIDYEGSYRGAKRIIYSDDGLIFYTEDHYKTFEELYSP